MASDSKLLLNFRLPRHPQTQGICISLRALQLTGTVEVRENVAHEKDETSFVGFDNEFRVHHAHRAVTLDANVWSETPFTAITRQKNLSFVKR